MNTFGFSLCAIAAVVLAGMPVMAQQAVNAQNCSEHFQARAAWMKGLDGHAITTDFMQRYAEILWLAIPKDCGMYTGPSHHGCDYRPDNEAVTQILIEWADTGNGFSPRPLCMEDAFCASCTELVRQISQ